ncbi:hypothetical protein D3C77_606120 [compost metagenome]
MLIGQRQLINPALVVFVQRLGLFGHTSRVGHVRVVAWRHPGVRIEHRFLGGVLDNLLFLLLVQASVQCKRYSPGRFHGVGAVEVELVVYKISVIFLRRRE